MGLYVVFSGELWVCVSVRGGGVVAVNCGVVYAECGGEEEALSVEM